MPISLKHINTSDSDNIKLDKVNYNFDQLVANGGGPSGPQGPIGQSGVQGTTGYQGFQGTTGDNGFQGNPGIVSESYWKRILPPVPPVSAYVDADTLIPVSIGTDQFAPVVNIGYMESDPQYGVKLPLVGGKTPYQWLIHRLRYSPSNLTFLNSLIPNNSYNFRLEKTINGKDQLTIGFDNPLNSISTYNAGITSFRSSISSLDNLTIDDTSASFKTATQFDSPVIIKQKLIINDPTADTNKIAVCDNNTGLVKFKSVQELGGTVPFGAIVSIEPNIFLNNNNFINTEQVTLSSDIPVQISAGKGIATYEGWYLCHGKQWTDGTPSGTYQVPMLGKFNYNIEDNPFSTDPAGQGSVITSNNKTHITGGSDVDMTATAVPTLVYNITSTVNTVSLNAITGTGTTFKIKQLPQIIYLGRNDLYWSDSGNGQAPQSSVTYKLDDVASIIIWNLPTVTKIHTSATGLPTQLTMEIYPPANGEWAAIPPFTSPSGITAYALSIPAPGDPLVVTIDVDSQGADGSEVIIEYSAEDGLTFISTLVVDAGPDFTLYGPANMEQFNGSVSGNVGIGITQWTQDPTNPLPVVFSNEFSLNPTVSGFDADGIYNFTLTGNFGVIPNGETDSDNMFVEVIGAVGPPPPPSAAKIAWKMEVQKALSSIQVFATFSIWIPDVGSISIVQTGTSIGTGFVGCTIDNLLCTYEGEWNGNPGSITSIGVMGSSSNFMVGSSGNEYNAVSLSVTQVSRSYPYTETAVWGDFDGATNGSANLQSAVGDIIGLDYDAYQYKVVCIATGTS